MLLIFNEIFILLYRTHVTLVTYGEIQYGEDRILLNSSYWVDNNNAFCDLLFYNILNDYF